METPANFVSSHVARVEALLRTEALEEWESAATGEPEHDERVAQVRAQIMRIYADPTRFAQPFEHSRHGRCFDFEFVCDIGRRHHATIATERVNRFEVILNGLRGLLGHVPRSR